MELNYNSASELRAFLEKENLGMRKKFGQNFLINPDVRARLVAALEAEAGSAVWEIGPGLGAMTRLLLDKGLAVTTFEIDTGFIKILKCLFADDAGFSLVEGDVMKTWTSERAAPFLLGNLPYNIGSALIADMIERGRLFTRMVVTVQKEVALRMAAAPGSGDYSSFSVLCASAYNVTKLSVIKGASFYPRPNVDSQGVKFVLRPDFREYPAAFYPLVRALFASRRKMIKNNLADFLITRTGNAAKRKSADVLAAGALGESGLSGNERAENLGVSAFARLAQTIEDMRILA